MIPASTKGGTNTSLGWPDVCKTPTGYGPIPMPYANLIDGLAASGDADAKETQKKIVDDAARKGSDAKSATTAAIFSRTQGDEAGTLKDVISSKTTSWNTTDQVSNKKTSSKIKVKGKQLVHSLALVGHNGSNANMPAGMQVSPSQTKVIDIG